MKKAELLAPAGSIEALKAAVWAGADAVYFGGKAFNARAFAGNFEGEEMKTAIEFCRLYGVKVYITLNTLLSDKEIETALKFVRELEESTPPDAYIVQDLGLVKCLKHAFPELPIHASTQMQQHSADGVKLMRSMGISRVVLARESTKEDIAAVVASGMETEIFVHGALCVSQSGGCLMSSFIGGRSGNRGECAQPCRQCYGGKYPLSLKDMCLAKHIPEIIKLGVDCLKIEGRMKSAEYVYEVVSIYRRLIDENRSATDSEMKRLTDAFSRSGFTQGYFVGKVGKDMFGVRTQQDKDNSRNANINTEEKKLEVNIYCSIKKNEPSVITAYCGDRFATVRGAVPQEAINRPLCFEELAARLSKTGATPFVAKVEAELDEGLILPMSAINELRRSVLDKLAKEIIDANKPKRDLAIKELPELRKKGEAAAPILVARFEGGTPSERVLKEAMRRCVRVELPLWADVPAWAVDDRLSLVLPRTIFPRNKAAVNALLEKAQSVGVRDLTVSNFAHLEYCGGFVIHGDYPLNVTNSYTADVLKNMGFHSLCVSPEINPARVRCENSAYIIYGKTPLMHTESCIISNVTACRKKGVCKAELRDKTSAVFPVIREYGHRNIIYNSVPTYLIDKLDSLKGVNEYILMFTDESEEEILSVFKAVDERKAPVGAYTRGGLKREGSVFR